MRSTEQMISDGFAAAELALSRSEDWLEPPTEPTKYIDRFADLRAVDPDAARQIADRVIAPNGVEMDQIEELLEAMCDPAPGPSADESAGRRGGGAAD